MTFVLFHSISFWLLSGYFAMIVSLSMAIGGDLSCQRVDVCMIRSHDQITQAGEKIYPIVPCSSPNQLRLKGAGGASRCSSPFPLRVTGGHQSTNDLIRWC